MKVIYFGTPLFAAHVLEYLLKNDINVVAVVSKPDRPKGRSSTPVATPVKVTAHQFNSQIPVYQPEIVSALEFSSVLQAHQADLFVVVAYGEIIKQHLLDMPKKACINLHASLLPKYRGAAPIQRCIIAGETESGVTIMHMVKKMDAGNIIQKVVVPIGPDTTFGELEQSLCDVGKEALLKTIFEFENEEPPQYPQDHSLATFAPKIELEDCEVYWNQRAQQIHNLVRGVNPHPGAWCMVTVKGEKKRLKINKTRIVAQQGAPGAILNRNETKGNLWVATQDQALELIDVQLEGKKSMSSEELVRGISRSQIEFIK